MSAQERGKQIHDIIEEQARELQAVWLQQHGWREGRDGLWRNNSYGGSWKLENAIDQEKARPVLGRSVSQVLEAGARKPSLRRMLAFAKTDTGKKAADWAANHTYAMAAYTRGKEEAHPQTVLNALQPPDGRFYGGAQDAVAILQSLLDAALRENERMKLKALEGLDTGDTLRCLREVRDA